ncbi:hypothetical protein [Granulosicoccus antarcticus]|uniref:MxaK protein n=1 Tax=Granulosicoccus antarcticus IMCC3135 TaxID=1192854 RepID=A0A2Z2NIA5_9GAMM|nr:hypothetical protein [Granulosicoccus antarcticus]ASJ70205.1 hypothetical protein IMCC3135_00395 [Granulosicoccus antarcticus IMCC3135]
MKRRHVSAIFATLGVALAALSASQWKQLHDNRSINQALRQTPDALSAEQFADPSVDAINEQPLELQFARATALLHGGELELAEKHLSAMVRNTERPQLALAAQFNLANGYLREALNTKVTSGQYRSLIELAKQRYRDLLSKSPEHWETRHNLELALRLSPEKEAYEVDDKGKPIKSVSVAFPGFEDRELP